MQALRSNSNALLQVDLMSSQVALAIPDSNAIATPKAV